MPLDPRRAHNVGASEVPALFSSEWLVDESPDDIDPFETRFSLWMRKAGRLPVEDDSASAPDARDRRFWGTKLEPAIAQGVADLTGWEISPGGFVEHPRVTGMSSTTDFRVRSGDWSAVMEIKNVDRYQYRRWPERTEEGIFVWDDGKWTESKVQPPFKFKLQTQAQMAVEDEDAGVIAALIGGNDLKMFMAARHPGVIARIETEVALFWDSIARNDPPVPNWEVDYQTVAALLGSAAEGSIKDLRGNAEAAQLAADYEVARKAEDAAKKQKSILSAKIKAAIGDSERALFDGFKLWAGEVPEGYVEGYTRKGYRGFKLTEEAKKRKK